jgi:hypothetical protein
MNLAPCQACAICLIILVYSDLYSYYEGVGLSSGTHESSLGDAKASAVMLARPSNSASV